MQTISYRYKVAPYLIHKEYTIKNKHTPIQPHTITDIKTHNNIDIFKLGRKIKTHKQMSKLKHKKTYIHRSTHSHIHI